MELINAGFAPRVTIARTYGDRLLLKLKPQAGTTVKSHFVELTIGDTKREK